MKRHWFPLVLSIILFLSYFSILARAQAPAPLPQNAPAPSSAASDKQLSGTETMDRNDPLFGVPGMPHGKVSLIGGTVEHVDPIRQRISLRTFGNNKKMTLGYDERSHMYRDGVEVTYKGVQKGERVYVDSMLDGTKLFARNVRVVTTLRPADARGQILQYNARTGIMAIRDDLSSAPVYFRVTKETQVKGAGADSNIDLVPGSLVAVHFSSDHHKRDTAQEVTILAMPGAMFTFTGKVRHLDVKSGVMAVESSTDNKTYEINFDPGAVGDDVTLGSDVTISAEFQGNRYHAKSVKVIGTNPQSASE